MCVCVCVCVLGDFAHHKCRNYDYDLNYYLHLSTGVRSGAKTSCCVRGTSLMRSTALMGVGQVSGWVRGRCG